MLAAAVSAAGVRVGADREDEWAQLLDGKRVALLSNHTGVLSSGEHVADAMLRRGVDLVTLMSPEHGFRGTADAGEHVKGSVDTKTGLPVVSLYGSGQSLEKALENTDVAVVDLQDVGLRFYTYYITMMKVMNAAARQGMEVVVLDRPNPNGMSVDGPTLDMKLKSGVGALPIPVLHGMTMGELAQMINGEGWLDEGRKARLTVVPCEGYTHATRYELPVPPSPNLKSMQAVYLYPSTCLFEGTVASLGRGTDNPFCMYGHPLMKGGKFTFTPKSMPGAKNPPLLGKLCRGTDLRNENQDSIIARGVDLSYVIDAYKRMPKGMKFFTPFFDKLIGSAEITPMIKRGMSAESIRATWQEDVARFKQQRKPYLLYPEKVSAMASRRADNAAFFTGGRKAPWPVVAFAMAGAAISGVTFISVPGMVASQGYAYLQMVLGFIVGYAVIAAVLVPLFYKRNLVSIYGYLEERFGSMSHSAGSWLFFVSKMSGASVRFFVVCAVLQVLVFDPLGVPFALNVLVTVALIWLYTARGGVKTLIWTDVLKSFCLIASVVLCIWFIGQQLGLDSRGLMGAIAEHPTSQIWHFGDPMSGMYFWKQFVAGVFMAIATNGLDQDMMQRHLACKDSVSSRKNMILSGVMQFFVIGLFLMLGTLMMVYCAETGVVMPEKGDQLFVTVAAHEAMPAVVGVLFVLGLISASYSAAGSALTSLTSTFTLDILRGSERGDQWTARARRPVHVAMSLCMSLIIIAMYYLSEESAITAVYTLAAYTYVPILGLFSYGLICRRRVRDRMIPWVCLAAPALAWLTQWGMREAWGYETSFELLIINALFTMAGLAIFSLKPDPQPLTDYA